MQIELNNFDIIVISIVSISTIIGFSRGITKSLMWMVTIALCFYLMTDQLHLVERYLNPYIKNPSAKSFAAAISIILFSAILRIITTKAIKTLISFIGLSVLDHIFGAVFGALRGILVAYAIFFIISLNAQTKKLMDVNSSTTWPFISKFYRPIIQPFANRSYLSQARTIINKQIKQLEGI